MTSKDRDGVWVPISHFWLDWGAHGGGRGLGSGWWSPGICWVMLLCLLSLPRAVCASLSVWELGTEAEGRVF